MSDPVSAACAASCPCCSDSMQRPSNNTPNNTGKFGDILHALQNSDPQAASSTPATGGAPPFDPRLALFGVQASMLNTLSSMDAPAPGASGSGSRGARLSGPGSGTDLFGMDGMGFGGLGPMGLGGLNMMGLGGPGMTGLAGAFDPMQGIESVMEKILAEVEKALQMEQQILARLSPSDGSSQGGATTPQTNATPRSAPAPQPSLGGLASRRALPSPATLPSTATRPSPAPQPVPAAQSTPPPQPAPATPSAPASFPEHVFGGSTFATRILPPLANARTTRTSTRMLPANTATQTSPAPNPNPAPLPSAAAQTRPSTTAQSTASPTSKTSGDA